jgi:hypothetical protein
VNEPRRDGPNSSRPTLGAGDDDYASAYSEGYGEGLREAFREMLSHASRGHTASELRLLIESRLARLREDIEFKRKSLLTPPRRPSWGAILRPPAPPTAWEAPRPSGAVVIPRRSTFLFREERGVRAAECADASAAGFPRVLAIGLRPPALPHVDPARVTFVPIQGGGAPGAIVTPTSLSGRIREAAEAPGGALVYFDAVETLTTENGVDQSLKFITWLVGETGETDSALVVSVDPNTLEPRAMSLLQRAFERVF